MIYLRRQKIYLKIFFYPSQLSKGFIDEDDGDEDGEDFLGEA